LVFIVIWWHGPEKWSIGVVCLIHAFL